MMNRSYRRPIVRGVAATVASLSLAALAAPAAHAVATSPPLGTAANFAAVAATTITNTGPTIVTGDLGVFPGTAVVGFPPGIVNGTIHAGDAVAGTAAADVLTAYNFAAGEPCDFTLSNPDLGGATLLPGVYCFTSTSVGLTGTLTLNANGNANAAWLFKTGSTLTTASNSAVVLINGATPCNNNNITWQVGSSATIGSATSFVGNVLASASVTLNTGATSTGSLYGHTGAVTMDSDRISTCAAAGPGGKAGPALKTTPSDSVPVGGSISDSATVIGGASPTGSVVFKLYGPGDTTCTTPIATRTGVLSGDTATSGDVTAATPGTYNWVATYGGDAGNEPATSPCGSEKVLVTSQILTGRAFGLRATATLLGLPIVNVLPIPDTGHVSKTSSSTTTTPCVATLSGAVGAHALCAKVVTVASPAPARSTASASVADSSVAITLTPTVTTRAVQSTSTTTCAGSSGTTTIAYLKVGSTVVIAQPTNVAPNTKVTVGVVKLVLNEQIPFSTPDAGLTVNAVHETVNAGGVAANVIIASSESDIGNCA
ncbi:MAG: hypothetical protein QOG56_423 [Solirubrobacteraceae bacterium]|jgi:hypothetical protein|nr:hypothetical protein [Solirubrobacteraceae bacterium]